MKDIQTSSTSDDIIDLEEYAKSGKPVPKGKRYKFRVGKETFTTDKEKLTGREILTIAGKIPPEIGPMRNSSHRRVRLSLRLSRHRVSKSAAAFPAKMGIDSKSPGLPDPKSFRCAQGQMPRAFASHGRTYYFLPLAGKRRQEFLSLCERHLMRIDSLCLS